MKRSILSNYFLVFIFFYTCNTINALGHIVIINPIIAILGITPALSSIAHNAYQSYIQRCLTIEQIKELPADVVLAECSYYIQRISALESLKQDFLCIKNDLENIKAFCGASSASFTHQFLPKNNISHKYCRNQLLNIRQHMLQVCGIMIAII